MQLRTLVTTSTNSIVPDLSRARISHHTSKFLASRTGLRSGVLPAITPECLRNYRCYSIIYLGARLPFRVNSSLNKRYTVVATVKEQSDSPGPISTEGERNSIEFWKNGSAASAADPALAVSTGTLQSNGRTSVPYSMNQRLSWTASGNKYNCDHAFQSGTKLHDPGEFFIAGGMPRRCICSSKMRNNRATEEIGGRSGIARASGSRWTKRIGHMIRRGQQQHELNALVEDEAASTGGENDDSFSVAATSILSATSMLDKELPVPLDAVHPELQNLKPTWNSRRTGILAYKVGMMSLWDGWGERHAVTVCQVDRCVVVGHRTLASHGYEACVLGLGFRSPARVSKPQLGEYIRLGLEPKAHTSEFKVSSECLLPVGTELSVRHFTPGQWCFVSGWSKAKGFQGPVKRWGFKGQNASHGVEHKAHRSHGSIGQSKSVNVVWKFKKMAGHMGPDPRVVNCQVMRIQVDKNLIFLKGCVPGGTGAVLKISDARGKTHQKNRGVPLCYPTFVPRPGTAYAISQDSPDAKQDPFVYPEIPIHDKE